MKYILFIFIIITLLLTSCVVQYENIEDKTLDETNSKEETTSIEFEENYYNNMTETVKNVSNITQNSFFYKYQDRIAILDFYGMNYYINEKTGNINNMNTDPLYIYDKDLYQDSKILEVNFLKTPDALKYHNDTIFYLNEIIQEIDKKGIFTYEICSTALDGQNKQTYCNSNGYIWGIFPYDDYLYFSAQGLDGNVEVNKLDYKTKNVTPIQYDGNNRGYSAVYESGDERFCTKAVYTLIKTDKEFTKEEIIEEYAYFIMADDKYLFYMSPRKTKTEVFETRDLYRYDMKTGEKIKLYENVWSFYITDNNVYFTKKVEKLIPNPNPQPGDKDFYDLTGGKIYRINKDGNNEALLRNDSEVYYYEDFAVFGDYIYARYFDYTDNLYTIHEKTFGDERQSYVRYGRVRIDSPDSKFFVLKKPE